MVSSETVLQNHSLVKQNYYFHFNCKDSEETIMTILMAQYNETANIVIISHDVATTKLFRSICDEVVSILG